MTLKHENPLKHNKLLYYYYVYEMGPKETGKPYNRNRPTNHLKAEIDYKSRYIHMHVKS